MSRGRSSLLAVGYVAGLLSLAFGAWLLIEARSAATTDVGAITSGMEGLVGLTAIGFGGVALLLSGMAEYASRKGRAPDPRKP
ncbi:MAG: hypothetical protein JWP97_6531 [Labilithrix sp.]|nr:hypothetical protein [Labilithrix sp.]